RVLGELPPGADLIRRYHCHLCCKQLSTPVMIVHLDGQLLLNCASFPFERSTESGHGEGFISEGRTEIGCWQANRLYEI
uniref:Uncharacterized protein n=1 Tax=Anopheles albimanus TaxID=7167 RepID=A0A182FXH8_ANOAL